MFVSNLYIKSRRVSQREEKKPWFLMNFNNNFSLSYPKSSSKDKAHNRVGIKLE